MNGRQRQLGTRILHESLAGLFKNLNLVCGRSDAIATTGHQTLHIVANYRTQQTKGLFL
jgi:hypothetical protein